MKAETIILIPTYNRASILRIMLKGLVISTNRELFDVCIVDNGSTDETKKVAKAFKNILFRKEPKNLFIAKALNNTFFKQRLYLRYKYVIIMANDVLINKKTVETLIKFMKLNPKVGVSGPRHYDWFTNKLLNKGLAINPLTSLLSNNIPRNTGNKINHFHSCFAVRSDAFKKVGGFQDKLFPMVYEEPDLGNRIAKLGYTIEPCHNSQIWHPIELNKIKIRIPDLQVPKKRLYDSIPKAYLFFRNRIIYMRLHTTHAKFLIFYFLLNPVILLYYLPSIKRDFLPYVFRGILDGTIFSISKDSEFIRRQNMKILKI